MKNLNDIAVDLFDKLRSRFPSISIGDSEGLVTNKPEDARYFDFTYQDDSVDLGKVAVYIDETDGLTILFNDDMLKKQSQSVKNSWYKFLKQMRTFAKKRIMNFDVRNIDKNIFKKRDYGFLSSNRTEESRMNESKMYGNEKHSYEILDSAKLIIAHNKQINTEQVGARTRNIDKIYIENSERERFKYPYRHLSGARAMARHVAEGGNPYDDFGKYILTLSEEMWKLRKFKNYVNRSPIVAEGLDDYMEAVQQRVETVKKTINNLRNKKAYYETIESYTVPVLEEVPSEVKEKWIDQLTIRQFNEELADVFPYIYRLISESAPRELELEEYIDI